MKYTDRIWVYLRDYPLLFVAALARYCDAIYRKSHDTKVHFDNILGRRIYLHLGLESVVRIASEDDKLCFYRKSNSGVESFSINSLADSIELDKNQSIVYVVLPIDELRKHLLIEKLFLKMLKLKRKGEIDSSYIIHSLSTINKYNRLLDDSRFACKNSSIPEFCSAHNGAIQYYRNNEDERFELSYRNSIILANISSNVNLSKAIQCEDKYIKDSSCLGLYAETLPQRIIIFYLDNISGQTSRELLIDREKCPNLSRIFENKKFIRPRQSCTISNWTFPAAVSMCSGLSFENHHIYHPQTTPYTIINHAIYSTKSNQHHELLRNIYPQRFRCGTNWRMKPEHGLHYFYQHCMHNQFFADAYDTCAQAIKQFDIAANSRSIHWIDLMDSHHPLKKSVLPYGANNYLNSQAVLNGLHYQTGPKCGKMGKEQLNCARDIYISQIINTDRIIGSILDYSMQSIAQEDHLLLFVSDHGHNFPSKQGLYASIKEKHQAMFGFLWEGLNENDINSYQKLMIAPFDIMRLLSSVCVANEYIQANHDDYKYSQVFYPGVNYQFTYFYSAEVIYRYQTLRALPNCLIGETSKDKKNLQKFLSEGKWEMITEQLQKTVDSTQLPEQTLLSFTSVINSWLSTKY